MAVREFNGTTDLLSCAIGALSGMTFGTAAVLVKLNDVTDFRAFGHLHDSGGNFVCNPIGTNTAPGWEMHNGASGSQPSLAAVTIGVWYLVVVRKATGSALPRFSVYNYTAGTWAHGPGGTSLANWTAPGVGGTIQFSFQAGAGDMFNGRVAARAHWSNTLPWTDDATGDTAIQSAGLHLAATNWLAVTPSAFWLFNQASTATPVDDLSTAGTADQSSITGTTVITVDDPPGFDFALGAAAPSPAVGLQRWPSLGSWPRPQTPVNPPPSTVVTTNAPADVATATGTAPFSPSGGSISLNLISDSAIVATGTAFNATISTAPSTNAAAQVATGTGTANNPTVKVSPTPTTATATGAANNATVTTGSATNAAAGLASATGVANNATVKIAPTPTTATGAGVGNNATISTSGAANAAAGSASGTGTANSTTSKVSPTPGTATGAGVANDATVQTGSFTNAPATTATGSGVANNATSKVSPAPATATAAGVANNPSISTGSSTNASAGVASATGAANNPAVTRAATANAGVATGVGAITAAKLSVMAAAEAAVALAAALVPVISGAETNGQSAPTVTSGRSSASTATGRAASSASVTD